MTGSAINIAVSQVPGLMGITGFKFVPSYLLFRAFLIIRAQTVHAPHVPCYHQHTQGTRQDTKGCCLWPRWPLFLYAIRMTCDRLSRRYPRRGVFSPYVLRATLSNCYCSAKLFFFISAFRSAFVIVVLTLASWLYTRHRKSKKARIRSRSSVPCREVSRTSVLPPSTIAAPVGTCAQNPCCYDHSVARAHRHCQV
jgi:sodium-independent sulfate anion transporter 11